MDREQLSSPSDNAPPNKEAGRPLCVDLDGTLIRSDSLFEATCAVLRRNFFDIVRLPLWLSRGMAYFKTQVFERAQGEIDIQYLPYNQELLEALKAEHRRGRRLVLASGTEAGFAAQVAAHLGIFSEVLGSDAQQNLIGSVKADELVRRYGEQGFDYVGDSRLDLAVWKRAKSAWVVSGDKTFVQAAERMAPLEKRFTPATAQLKVYMKALRVHQWAKNVLIFLPTLLSDHITNPGHWLLCILAFISYSLISSSVYILNDLLDIEADRRHPDKRRRPFAAGTLSIAKGLLLVPLLLTGGLTLGYLLSLPYFLLVLGYFAMTCLYSLRVKQIVMADVITLALLYTWRVLAGGVVTDTHISEWFLTFALFFFLSLAALKRCSELILMEQNAEKKSSRRGYLVSDLPLIMAVGVANGYLSVLVLALYINDPKVAAHMRFPATVWMLCPIMLYWISRLWFKAYRGDMHTDPLVFALRDRKSYLIFFIAGALWLLARGPIFLTFTF